MTSEYGLDLPDDAPEADVLEQYQSSADPDEVEVGDTEVPVEADPADVDEQRRTVGGTDDDDYR